MVTYIVVVENCHLLCLISVIVMAFKQLQECCYMVCDLGFHIYMPHWLFVGWWCCFYLKPCPGSLPTPIFSKAFWENLTVFSTYVPLQQPYFRDRLTSLRFHNSHLQNFGTSTFRTSWLEQAYVLAIQWTVMRSIISASW